jgi:hypothetical protein
LTDQDYTNIKISRTQFGNTKFEARGLCIEREIVPGKSGAIMRDRTENDDDDRGGGHGDDGDA